MCNICFRVLAVACLSMAFGACNRVAQPQGVNPPADEPQNTPAIEFRPAPGRLGARVGTAQETPRLTFSIESPNGSVIEPSDVPDGDSGHIQFLWEGSYRNFYYWWNIRDREAGVVRFTIRAGREPDSELLDEIDATVGEPAAQTNTSPPFGLAVLRIEGAS